MVQPGHTIWDPGIANPYLQRRISMSSVIVADVNSARNEPDPVSRTELDSHANMPVIGRHSVIVNDTGRSVDVNPFSPDYQAMSVRIVDAVVRYDCPYDGISYLLMFRNALHVPSMSNNLIPPFMLREADIQVRDTPKIHVSDPSIDDHAISFGKGELRIPLGLWGVFSYFDTCKPSLDDCEVIDDVYQITPDRWNPHCDSFARNEDSMLDADGNMTNIRDQTRILLSELPDAEETKHLDAVEVAQVDALLDQADQDREENLSYDCSYVGSVYEDPDFLLDKLTERFEASSFACSIGATTTHDEDYLFDDGNADHMDIDLDGDDLDLFVSALGTGRTRSDIDATHLSKVWRIDLESAKRTLEATTQSRIHTPNGSLSRNFSTNDRMLRYKRIMEYFFMDTFFATKKAGKSTRGHTCAQLFVTDKGFVYIVPMKSKSEIPKALKEFTKAIGAPDAIICDHSKEQTSKEVRTFLRTIGTSLRVLERGTPWSNKAELYIGLIKEAVRKDMKESDCPLALWDYCCERRARINNLTAKNLFQLHGTTAHTATLHEEGDISSLCRYNWYEWCYYREKSIAFPMNQEVLGRVLGPATGSGNEMAQWILKANGRVVPRRSSRPLRPEEWNSATEEKKRSVFTALIEAKLGSSVTPMLPRTTDPDEDGIDELSDDEIDPDEPPRIVPDMDDIVDANGQLLNQQPAYDLMINAEVFVQKEGGMESGTVRQRALGPDGRVVGEYNQNPVLNSLIYEVEFSDGQVREYAANVIAESMLTQVDADGFSTSIMDGIIDFRKDANAVSKNDRWVLTKSGQRRARKTTCGWFLLVRWKDGSETWFSLKDMKEAHPVETAEFAKARGLCDEPAFSWWVPYTLRKRDVILSAVKARVRKTTHKYGIEMPTSVDDAYELDRKNGSDFWAKAIEKEMTNAGIAFEVLDQGQSAPPGWRKVTGHMVFDVKMDFTRKARWVLDGHKTPSVAGSTYAGVVSRESVRIMFTYAALNGLDVFAADILNAYLQAPSSQKDYVICGTEFGLENVGKVALIHRALYGGKAAGRDFRNHLRACMRHLNYDSCPADPDVWMRPAKKADGTPCYEYVLLYVDDALAIGIDPGKMLNDEIGKYFPLKPDSVGPPTIYLGGKVRKVELPNGVHAWAYGSSQYVHAAVKNVEDYLAKSGQKLPNRADTPCQTSYRPELDVTPELSTTDAAYYQSLIGIARWIVELGRVDICLEVSQLSSHLALPRHGHLQQMYHMFAYLKKHHNAEMMFDPSDPVVDETQFNEQDWSTTVFGQVQNQEELPPNMPEPRGQGFVMRAKVDADHAGDTTTRRSRTGFLVYLNCAPIYWLSRKQMSVESSSFGSEFTAMKQCCEYLRGLRYKLRMLGIPVEGHAYVFGDNQSVLANTTIPESTLKKKMQSICYHFVREGSARGEWRTSYVNTHDNESDLLTKSLPSGDKRRNFVRKLLYHIFGH